MGRARRPEHTGVLRIDKPGGVTSHDVVQMVRRQMGQRQVGHTGTLDPMATGLLVLTLGKATRLGRFLEAAEKEYEGRVVLGTSTDTYDAEGQVTESVPVPALSREEVSAAAVTLVGSLEQRVPAFSAVKVGGERLHAKARRGDVFEAPVRTVQIHDLRVTAWSHPCLDIEVVCSKGTYIRTLATQIGDALSVPAHLSHLRRTRVGPHRVEDAVAPDQCGPDDLVSMPEALSHLAHIELNAELCGDVSHGRPLVFGQLAEPVSRVAFEAGEPVVLLHAGKLVAVAYPICASASWAAHPAGDRALRYACVLSA